MEVAAMSNLTQIRLTFKGIPPKWCPLKTFAKVASLLVILMDVDCPVLLKSLYTSARIEVALRDVSKVPSDRIVEMEHKLYMLTFLTEILVASPVGGDDNPPRDTTMANETTPTLMNAETTAIPSTTPNAPNIIVPSAGGGTNSAKNGTATDAVVIDVSCVHYY
jgi:hypothetical protein